MHLNTSQTAGLSLVLKFTQASPDLQLRRFDLISIEKYASFFTNGQMNKTFNDQSKYFASINKDMSETRRADETIISNKDDEHRGSSGYARARQAAPQAEMADNSTLGVAASE